MFDLTKVETTERGFEIIDFQDYYSEPCSLQQSSLFLQEPPGTSAVWLGVGRRHRMHLERHQVEALINVLQRWVDTGSFRFEKTDPPPTSP